MLYTHHPVPFTPSSTSTSSHPLPRRAIQASKQGTKNRPSPRAFDDTISHHTAGGIQNQLFADRLLSQGGAHGTIPETLHRLPATVGAVRVDVLTVRTYRFPKPTRCVFYKGVHDKQNSETTPQRQKTLAPNEVTECPIEVLFFLKTDACICTFAPLLKNNPIKWDEDKRGIDITL